MAAVVVEEVVVVAEARLPEVEAGCPAPLPIAAAAAPSAGSTGSTACSSGIHRKRHTDLDRPRRSTARIVRCSPLHLVDLRRLASPHRQQHLPLLPLDS